MRVLLTGASGVIGRQLTPLLTAAGHDVFGLARSQSASTVIEALGARPVMADLLEASSVAAVIRANRPDAIVHMATAIPQQINPRMLAAQFMTTNRLRNEGTRNLATAAAEQGVARFIAQGLAYAYSPIEGNDARAAARSDASELALADENVPLWEQPPTEFAPVLAALQALERWTAEANGLVLRLGHLYGPGSAYAADGYFSQQVRAGKVPIVGRGLATFSFIHAHDAASAVVAALDKDLAGALNVVDDDPVRLREWLPVFAGMLGAPHPRSAPALLARLAVGGWGVAFMTRLRGADNVRAKLDLDWKPRYSSWRAGFAAELGATATMQRN